MIGLAVAAAVFFGPGGPPRPNVIVVLVDDMGWQDTSLKFGLSQNMVGRHFRTPNLEELAKRGLTVNQAYSSATVCTPSRTALLTGLSPARTGITNWVGGGGDTDPNHVSAASLKWTSRGLQPGDYRTVPSIFAEAGYVTAHVGKAHFGAVGTLGAEPKNLGFQINIAGGGLGNPNSYYGLDNFASKKTAASGARDANDVPGLEKYHGKDIFLEEALATEASQVIADASKAKKPLFMLFAPYAVHTPIMPNRRLSEKHEKAGLDKIEAAYASLVESVDNALGTLQAELKRQNQLENTYVIFTSDNGGYSASARGGPKNLHNLPLRSGKGSAYEGGTRVPFVVAGPGIPAGKVLQKTSLVTADLFPTVLGFAGLTAPIVDGESLATEFSSVTEKPERTLVWHYPHYRGLTGPGMEPYSAIRKGDFKLIFFYLDKRWEMYNLQADPGETMDLMRILYDARREKYLSLAREMSAWLKERNANYPVEKSTGKAVDPSDYIK